MTLPVPPTTQDQRAWANWAAQIAQATRAFKVFTIVPGRKDPAEPGWQKLASFDPKTVDAMWIDRPDANIGLAIQPGFVALDADIYKPGAEAELARFEAEYGILPDTLEFRSARGGYHLIYSTTRLLGNAKGSLPAFGDVRGHGGYIVGPGSIFEGKRYEVEGLALPVPLPAHVDARLSAKREGSKELPPGVILDDPSNIAKFTIYLRGPATISVEGQGGNNVLAKTGAMGASHALSEEVTLELMAEHWNPRCEPPWDDTELERHGGSGYRSSSSQFGNLAIRNPLALGFKPVSGQPVQGDKLWHTMADIPGPAPARQWAMGTDLDGWMPDADITLLYGPGGAGKTTLGGQLALNQARGGKLFGSIPCAQMPVLFVSCEESVGELHRRFEKQGRRSDDQVEFASLVGRENVLHRPFRGPAGMDETALYTALDYKLAEMPAGPKLLIMDNLAHFYEGNYYEPSEIARFLNGYCRRLITAHQATMLLFAHPSEGQQQSGGGSYGGIGWSAGVRSRLYFDRHMRRVKEGRTSKMVRIGEQRIFSRKKSNMTKEHEEGQGVILEWQDWNFVPVAQAATPDQSKLFKPIEPVAEAAVLPLVQAAVENVLASNPVRALSHRALAEMVSGVMGKEGHRLEGGTIRRNYLPKLIRDGHPAFDATAATGRWRHAT